MKTEPNGPKEGFISWRQKALGLMNRVEELERENKTLREMLYKKKITPKSSMESDDVVAFLPRGLM